MPPITIVAEADNRYNADARCAWLVEAVYGWRARTEKFRRDPGRFHPSDLGRSDEEVIAAFRGETVERDEDRDPTKLMIFDNGHSMHRRWGRYLKKCGLTVKHTKSFWIPRLKLRGTCDEIVVNPATGETTIVELKSMNPFAFSRLTEPKWEHIDQLLCYLVGLRIPRGMLLYECKGTQAVKVFHVDFDKERWQFIESRLVRLRKIAEERKRWGDSQKPETVAAALALKEALAASEIPDIRDVVAAKYAAKGIGGSV